MLVFKFESSGLYTSSAKEKCPFAHIPFKAGFILITFMTVLFEVVRISIPKLKHQELGIKIL